MYRIYDSGFRGECPKESADQKTFFNQIRKSYPDTYGRIAFHARNEGKKTHQQAVTEKAEGMTKGTPDIHIPGCPAFVCELKRKDKTKNRPTKDQKEYLNEAAKLGAFACVAYGWEQAWLAFEDWQTQVQIRLETRDVD